MKLDILVFGAHPDDVELGCAGTLIKEVQNNKKVGIIDLTRGELGTRGSANTRDYETKRATEIMGITIRENMNFRDGFFANDEQHQMELVKMIRKYRPEIVLCNAVQDRHPDHGKGSKLVSDACFLAGLRKVETGQDAWRPKAVYHYIQFNRITPDFVVDVSDFIDAKIAAVEAYASQFYNPNSKEPETVISSKGFLDSVKHRSADLGRLSGVGYAEGFTVERMPAVDSLDVFLK